MEFIERKENNSSLRELAIHYARYGICSEHVRGMSVLDIGCGEGHGARFLYEDCAAKNVVGVDSSQIAIKNAESITTQSHEINYICSDAVNFIKENKLNFDVIVCIETIEHIKEDPEHFINLLSKKFPDAIIIISVPNDYQYFGPGDSLNPYHVHTFSFDFFKMICESNFGEGSWYTGHHSQGFITNSFDESSSSRAIESYPNITGKFLGLASEQTFELSRALYFLGVFRAKEVPNYSCYSGNFIDKKSLKEKSPYLNITPENKSIFYVLYGDEKNPILDIFNTPEIQDKFEVYIINSKNFSYNHPIPHYCIFLDDDIIENKKYKIIRKITRRKMNRFLYLSKKKSNYEKFYDNFFYTEQSININNKYQRLQFIRQLLSQLSITNRQASFSSSTLRKVLLGFETLSDK